MSPTATGLPAPGRTVSAGGVVGRRRMPRHLLVGAVLMVSFALLFATAALRADPAVAVLAITRPVAAGEVIEERDLRVARVVPDPVVQLVPASDRDSVVGRRAAVPLAAGSLLSPGQVGAVVWPPAGQSVLAVPVATGRLPAGLAPGSAVSVLPAGQPAPADGQGPAEVPAVVPAVVVSVEAPDVAGIRVVSLLLASARARQVAAAGEVVLVLESPAAGG